ncbi:MAG: hypothetical protein LBI10_08525 [Deltaproteobacteria bacterium]|jgi:hypothetical protein|nr:hypothetical protein [Deltaproteobacteria bacterium]
MAKKNNVLDQKKNKKTAGRDLNNQIDNYLLNDDVVAARAVYESMSKLGRSPTTDNQKAKAAHKLILWYADNGATEMALPLFQALARRSENSEVLILLLNSLTVISTALEARGQSPISRDLRLSIWTPPTPAASISTRVMALKDAIFDLCQKNRLDEAIPYFKVLTTDSPPPPHSDAPLILATALIASLCEDRRPSMALLFYKELNPDLWSDPNSWSILAPAMVSLIRYLSYAQKTDEAILAYNFFKDYQDLADSSRLLAATSILESLLMANSMKLSIQIWRELNLSTDISNRLLTRFIRVSSRLIERLCQNKLHDEAISTYRELVEKLQKFPDEKPFSDKFSSDGFQGSHLKTQTLFFLAVEIYGGILKDPVKFQPLWTFLASEVVNLKNGPFGKHIENDELSKFFYEGFQTNAFPDDIYDKEQLNKLAAQYFTLFGNKNFSNGSQNKSLALNSPEFTVLDQNLQQERLNQLCQIMIDQHDFYLYLISILDLLRESQDFFPPKDQTEDKEPSDLEEDLAQLYQYLDEPITVGLVFSRAFVNEATATYRFFYKQPVEPLFESLTLFSEILSLPEYKYLWNFNEPFFKLSKFYAIKGFNFLTNTVTDLYNMGYIEKSQELYASVPWVTSHFSQVHDLHLPAILFKTSIANDDNDDNQTLTDHDELAYVFHGELAYLTKAHSNLLDFPSRFDSWLTAFESRVIKEPLSTTTSEFLSSAIKDAAKVSLERREKGLANRALSLLTKLGKTEKIQFEYLVASKNLILELTEHGYQAEALGALDLLHNFLCPTDQPPPKWAYVGLANAAEPLFKILSPVGRGPLEKVFNVLLEKDGDRFYRLVVMAIALDVLTTTVPGASPLGGLKIAARAFEWINQVDSTEFLPVETAAFELAKHQIRLAYQSFLLAANRIEEAVNLFERSESQLNSLNPGLTARAIFLKDLVKTLIKNQRLTEALEWLTWFAKLPVRVEVEWRQVEATKLAFDALVAKGDLLKAQQVADRLVGAAEGIYIRACQSELYSLLVKNYSQADQLEEALNLYLKELENPDSCLVYPNRLTALTALVEGFLRQGETTTAGHLFVNRHQFDPDSFSDLEEDLKDEEEEVDKDDNFKKSLNPRINNNSNKLILDTKNLIIRETLALSDKVADLVRECLRLEEEDRALTIFQSFENLPFADSHHVNKAARYILEFMLRDGRETEAETFAQNRAENLEDDEANQFLNQFERMARPNVPVAARKVKARAH